MRGRAHLRTREFHRAPPRKRNRLVAAAILVGGGGGLLLQLGGCVSGLLPVYLSLAESAFLSVLAQRAGLP